MVSESASWETENANTQGLTLWPTEPENYEDGTQQLSILTTSYPYNSDTQWSLRTRALR